MKQSIITKPPTKTIKERIKSQWKNNKYLYILTIPILLYFILFKYLPMFGLVISFKDYRIGKGFMGSEWVGLKYFEEFFASKYFFRILRNTLIISLANIVFGFPIPIIFALMINELRGTKFKKIVQTASYLPHFISLVVICGMIVDFFSTDGLITTLLTKFGVENASLIADPKYFRSIFITTGIWQEFGWNSIIYLAALAGVDESLYEAASIDGAGRWKQLIHVTLPGISSTIVIMLIMRFGQVLSVSYEKVMLLYSAQTYEVGDVISSYAYRSGILDNRYSYSAAVGLFQSVINIIILFTANTISKKYSETSLF